MARANDDRLHNFFPGCPGKLVFVYEGCGGDAPVWRLPAAPGAPQQYLVHDVGVSGKWEVVAESDLQKGDTGTALDDMPESMCRQVVMAPGGLEDFGTGAGDFDNLRNAVRRFERLLTRERRLAFWKGICDGYCTRCGAYYPADKCHCGEGG